MQYIAKLFQSLIFLFLVHQGTCQNPIFTSPEQSPYDLANFVRLDDSENFSVATEDTSPLGVVFNNDGSKMYVIGNADDAIVEYDLTEAFDISTGSHAGDAEELLFTSIEDTPTGLRFSQDGSKLYLVGFQQDAVISFTLGTNFDVSTATYDGAEEAFDFGSEEGQPGGLAFSTDGLKLFVVGRTSDAVVEYTLTSAFDVSTATYNGEAEELAIGGNSPGVTDLAFSSDGSKLFVIGSSTDNVVQYDLSTAFDVSSGSLAAELFVGAEENSPQGLAFGASGTRLFVSGTQTDAVVEYVLATMLTYPENGLDAVIDINANDGLEGADDSSVTYQLEGPDAALFDIDDSGLLTFKQRPDFEDPLDSNADNDYEVVVVAAANSSSQVVLIISVENDTDERKPIITSPIPLGYDVSSLVYEGEFAIGDEDDNPLGITFSVDGTRMFVIGNGDDRVVSYDLNSPFALGSATHAGFDNELNIANEENTGTALSLNGDGTKLFVTGFQGHAIVEYELETAYDLTSATYSGESEEFIFEAQETEPGGFVFNSDGSKLFIVGREWDEVIEYDLSSSYDVSTAVHAGENEEFSVADQVGSPTGIAFNSEGTKMFILGSNSGSVFSYDLATAFDVSTAVYEGSMGDFFVGDGDASPQGMHFSPDGTQLFVVGTAEDVVVVYSSAQLVDYPENDNSFVLDIEANDGDGGENDSSVAYSLDGPDAANFSINSEGQLSFNNAPNFEDPTDLDAGNTYEVTIEVANEIEESRLFVVVTVLDLNPEITSGFDVTVPENTSGTIYTATADETVTFSLGTANDESLFTLADEALSFTVPADFESPLDLDGDNKYIVELIAQDNDQNTSTRTVTITVTDVDDTPPVITSAITLSIVENTEGGIYTPTANEEATFTLGNSKDEDLFSLAQGVLSFNSAPDFEAPLDNNADNEYLVDLIASDALGNSSSQEVSITVTDDASDNPLGLATDDQIIVFPNPSAQVIRIANRIDFTHLIVQDLQGRALLSSDRREVDISRLSTGSYVLRVFTKKGIVTKSILKQ